MSTHLSGRRTRPLPHRPALRIAVSLVMAAVLGVAVFAAAAAPAQAREYVVVIDAGHQAKANLKAEPIGPGSKSKKPSVAGGTSGVVTKKPESVIALQVALKLRDKLEARGVKVIMVRTEQKVNIPNSKRAKIANAANADLFIRLHCDGVNKKSIKGFLTLVPGKNKWTGPIVKESARAGKLIHAATLKTIKAKNRGITPRKDMAGFNWATVPSVIVEMGVMTNPAEDRLLASSAYQDKLAEGMANGIMKYLEGR